MTLRQSQISGPSTVLPERLEVENGEFRVSQTKRVIEQDDRVMIDLHPIANGYSADICRTVCVGEPTAEQRQAYDLFVKAQQRGDRSGHTLLWRSWPRVLKPH